MSDAKDPKDETQPRKGGFGAFADQYRDRWAADHPKSKSKSQPASDTTTPAEPADAAAPDATDDPGAGPRP